MTSSPRWVDSSRAFRFEAEEYGTPSVAVSMGIAALSDRKVRDIPQLQDSIEPDALDQLVECDRAGSAVRVCFQYADYRVEVSGEREVWLEPLPDAETGDVVPERPPGRR